MVEAVKSLIKYRWLLQLLIERDLKIKYRRSVLGYLWSVLNPLMMMTILTIVFSSVFRFDIPNYPVYLLAGQLMFGFFSESTSIAMTAILDGAPLIKKVKLPKYIFPLSRVLSSFVSMLLSMTALFLVMIFTDMELKITLVLLPFIILLFLLFCIGVGMMISAAVVYFRDLKYLYTVMLTALTYLTPLFYPISIIPPEVKPYVLMNPLYSYILFFREVAVYGIWPTPQEYINCILISLGTLLLGSYVFKKCQSEFILYV